MQRWIEVWLQANPQAASHLEALLGLHPLPSMSPLLVPMQGLVPQPLQSPPRPKMRAFEVGLDGTTPKVVQAQEWEVEDGLLVLHTDGHPVAAFPQGVWLWVIEIPEAQP